MSDNTIEEIERILADLNLNRWEKELFATAYLNGASIDRVSFIDELADKYQQFISYMQTFTLAKAKKYCYFITNEQ